MLLTRKSKITKFVAIYSVFVFFCVCEILIRYEKEISIKNIRSIGIAFDTRLAVYLLTTLIAALIITVISTKIDVPKFLFRYRFAIATLLLVIGVLFEISGSSIGVWSKYLGVEDTGLLLGTSRAVRSDEWAVSLPITISQYYNTLGNFSIYNDVVRATPTDVFSVAATAPAWNILTLFRPFLWGFLFLPVAKGLSFYWCSKVIVLFLVSFEFGRMITNDTRYLSLIYAILITFSPFTQWWSIGMASMLIATELSTVVFDQYLNTESYKKRVIYLLIIIWCAGCYMFDLYPAWQIPLAYVLLAIIIWLAANNKNSYIRPWKDVCIVLVFCVAVGTILLYFLSIASSTIEIVSNTVYPGARNETGGTQSPYYLFNYASNIWSPYSEKFFIANQSEDAQLFHLFPLPVLLSVYALIKTKKKDLLSLFLLLIGLFLFIFIFIGYPEIIAKISFLSVSPARRTYNVWQLCNVILLIRSIYLLDKRKKEEAFNTIATGKLYIRTTSAAVISIVISAVTVICTQRLSPDLWKSSQWKLAGVFIVVAIIIFLILKNTTADYSRELVYALLIIHIMCGSLVNPIRSGLDFLDKSSIVNEFEQLETEDNEAVWIIDGLGYPYTNLGLMKGANTINSTNIYPDLERWALIDPKGQYSDIYNRYAQINVIISENKDSSFELLGEDLIQLNLSKKDVQLLGVDYVLTPQEFPEYDLVYNSEGVKVYHIPQ